MSVVTGMEEDRVRDSELGCSQDVVQGQHKGGGGGRWEKGAAGEEAHGET